MKRFAALVLGALLTVATMGMAQDEKPKAYSLVISGAR
jgi:hypothetical protein